MVVKMRSIAIAAVVISGFAGSENLVASCSSTVILYQTINGTFGSNPVSGPDKLKLAGEPFKVTLYACESKTPKQVGSDYAIYSPIKLTGTVTSGLTGTAYPISAYTSVTLVKPPSGPDSAQLYGSPSVLGTTINLKGIIAVPAGTLPSTSIAPFPSVSIVTANSEFVYVKIAPAWKPSTFYQLGNEIRDSSGRLQMVTTAGTSGTTAPAWNATVGGSTSDGTTVWKCLGIAPTAASSVPAWKPSTPYTAGQEIMDPSGNVQVVMTAGTSGTTVPTWNATVGGTTSDSSVVWQCQGFGPTTLAVIGKVGAFPLWTPSTVYALGQEILDPSGNLQEVTTPGTSGTTAPTWTETVGGITSDNSVVWTCQGPPS